MVDICTKTIQSILSYFISRQTIIFDNKDHPWFNTKIKLLFQEKNKISKGFCKYFNKTHFLKKPEHLQNRFNKSIDSSKHNCDLRMANKLNSTQKTSRAY